MNWQRVFYAWQRICCLTAGIVVLGASLAQAQEVPEDKELPNPFLDPHRHESMLGPEAEKAELARLSRGGLLAAKGGEAVENGNLILAIKLYQQALKANPQPNTPSYVIATVGLGNIFAQQGKPEEALAAYDSLWFTDGAGRRFTVEGDSDKDVVLIRYAMLLRKAGRYSEALSAFQHAMQDGHMVRGLADVSVSQNINIDETTIQSSEFDKAAYLALGVGLVQINRSDEAVPYLVKATQLNSGSGLPYFYLAYALQTSRKAETKAKYGLPQAAYAKAVTLGSPEVREQSRKLFKAFYPNTPIGQ